MEFKNEEFVARELEITGYLLQAFSVKKIAAKTGLSKKHLTAHLRNMMEKLGAKDVISLKKILRTGKGKSNNIK